MIIKVLCVILVFDLEESPRIGRPAEIEGDALRSVHRWNWSISNGTENNGTTGHWSLIALITVRIEVREIRIHLIRAFFFKLICINIKSDVAFQGALFTLVNQSALPIYEILPCHLSRNKQSIKTNCLHKMKTTEFPIKNIKLSGSAY